MSAVRQERDIVAALDCLKVGENMKFADKCEDFSFVGFWQQAKVAAPHLTQVMELFMKPKDNEGEFFFFFFPPSR